MEDDLLYQLALSRVPGIGPVYARRLIREFGDAKTIFRTDQPLLEKICGTKAAGAIINFREFQELEKELSFLEKYSIRPLFITDKNYPQRLLHCDEIPVLLFYKGNTDLNSPKVIAIVGTRTPTEYGRQATERFIRDLASSLPQSAIGSASSPPDPSAGQPSPEPAPSGSSPATPSSSGLASSNILVISGLAYGIDAVAHQAALDNNLPTIGVLGHGLDRIYPQQHTSLAKKMVTRGGLLTNFNIGTRPENHNFPMRNRIVAGMSDALLVVETDSRGGSMLTAGNAVDYRKKIFAFPGRINDSKSSGCNALIRTGNAHLLTHAQQFLEDMKWEPAKPGAKQTALFPHPTDESNLSNEERRLLYLLRKKTIVSLDELSLGKGNNPYGNGLALALLNLELEGWIDPIPGKRYRLRG
ncbi:MAG TPA: DNA-processing protein DprA [Puia sp.]|nr:DNA-processing protein DprA [Puia sp.]